MENMIAQFNAAELNNAVAEFGLAQVIVAGKTVSEKKLSVVGQASAPAKIYMTGMKGKVGKQAREETLVIAEDMIAKAARAGNYKPLTDVIAVLTGASLTIRNRAEYESLAGRFEDQLRDLKNGGYIVCKKTGIDKPSSKRNVLMQVIALITEVHAIAASL